MKRQRDQHGRKRNRINPGHIKGAKWRTVSTHGHTQDASRNCLRGRKCRKINRLQITAFHLGRDPRDVVDDLDG